MSSTGPEFYNDLASIYSDSSGW